MTSFVIAPAGSVMAYFHGRASGTGRSNSGMAIARPRRRKVWVRTTEPGRTPFRALFIDENLVPPNADDDRETPRLRTRISEIFSPLFDEGRLELYAIHSPDGVLPSQDEHSAIGDSIVEIDRFFEHMLPDRIQRVDNWRLDTVDGVGPKWTFSSLSEKISLRDYEVIFCEIDYRSRFAGPQVVQKLASYLERTASRDGRSTVPALIVLSHMDNIGHVQQCLNLGAHSFVNKEQLYRDSVAAEARGRGRSSRR